MFKIGFACFVLAVAVAPKCAFGNSEEQKAKIQAHFFVVGAECIKDHPISEEDIAAFKDKKMPEGDKAACFASCLFKKIGIMDENGKVTGSGAQEAAKKVFDDEEDQKKVEEFVTTCATVNDEVVDDNDKNCERAKLAYKCLVENSAKFGFDF